MTRILIGSANVKKIEELRALLAGHGVEVMTLDDLPERPPEPEETGETFEENARIKALSYARETGLWALADDSGLEVDALGGCPGVRSARYAGEGATDAMNNEKLQREMQDLPDGQRSARYVAVVVLATPDSVLLEARGECSGVILLEPRGSGGFGYDPLFFVGHS